MQSCSPKSGLLTTSEGRVVLLTFSEGMQDSVPDRRAKVLGSRMGTALRVCDVLQTHHSVVQASCRDLYHEAPVCRGRVVTSSPSLVRD